MSDDVTCPDEETLRQFAVAELPPDQSDRIRVHLVECATCRDRLADCSSEGDGIDGSEFPPLIDRLDRPMLSCPVCRTRIDDDSRESLTCKSCGSAIRVASDTAATFLPMSKIDRYEIHEPLGGGAFGTVYLGRDPQLDRAVAIKIPRDRTLASGDGYERFEREARSVAQLKHPLIVTVYDVGVDQSVPYLVSEFVDGVTLAARLTTWRPTFQESAQLLAQLAEALDEAHRSNVVHRDVKPSNVMIDKQGRPRIMDFGLAKRQSDEVTMTVEGEILGTPAYMSPEQASGQSHDVDARADVYSLGVMLYELLTGVRPFQGDPRMVVRQVMEEEPRMPRRLNDRIPRDLETICLKAMDKSAGRRYATAGEMAGDLRGWLTGQPISARPIGSWERAWRRCRRFPRTAALAATAIALLVTVAVTATVGFLQATKLQRAADAQFQRAEENFQLAWDQVDRYFVQISENRLLDQPGMQPLRRELLNEAVEFYRQFARDRAGEPQFQLKVADSYMRIGLVLYILGDRPGSEAAYRDALATLPRVSPRQRRSESYAALRAQGERSLGVVLMESGHTGQAGERLGRAVSAFQSLAAADAASYTFDFARTLLDRARLLRRLNKLEEEVGVLSQAEPVIEALIARDERPVNIMLHAELLQARGAVYQLLRRPDAGEAYGDAIAAYTRLRELAPGDPNFEHRRARALYDWATYLVATDAPKSRSLYLEAGEIFAELANRNPAVPMYRLDRARTLMNLAAHAILTRDLDSAEQSLDNAGGLLEELVASDFSNFESQSVLARCWQLKYQVSAAIGDPAAALEALTRMIEFRKQLADTYPDQPLLAADLAQGHAHRSQFQFDLGDFQSAAEDQRIAVELLVSLAAGEGGERFKMQLGVAWAGLGTRQTMVGMTMQAEKSYQESSRVLQSIGERLDDVEWLGAQATALEGLANADLARQQYDDALTRQRKALDYRVRAADIAPQFVDIQFRRAESHRMVADTRYVMQQLTNAKTQYQLAADLLGRLRSAHPLNIAIWETLPLVYANLALIANAENDGGQCVRLLGEAETVQREILSTLPANAEHLGRLAGFLDSLATMHSQEGRHDASRQALYEAVELLKQAVKLTKSSRYHPMLVSAWTRKVKVLRAAGNDAETEVELEREAAERWLDEHGVAAPLREMFRAAVDSA